MQVRPWQLPLSRSWRRSDRDKCRRGRVLKLDRCIRTSPSSTRTPTGSELHLCACDKPVIDGEERRAPADGARLRPVPACASSSAAVLASERFRVSPLSARLRPVRPREQAREARRLSIAAKTILDRARACSGRAWYAINQIECTLPPAIRPMKRNEFGTSAVGRASAT